MNLINKFYLNSILISIIIFYLLSSDIKKIKYDIYDKINENIWIKLYSFILIGIIHLIWAFFIILLDCNDTSLVYGFPLMLLVPYIIYVLGDFYEEDDETTVSKKINKYLNYLMSAYIVCIIILILIPNNFKIKFIELIKTMIHRFFKLIIV